MMNSEAAITGNTYPAPQAISFVEIVKQDVKGFPNPDHHLVPMGGDFHYSNATQVTRRTSDPRPRDNFPKYLNIAHFHRTLKTWTF